MMKTLIVFLLTLPLLAGLTAQSAEPGTNAPPARYLERLDLNHDGRINLEEFYHSGPPPLHPRMKQVFDSLDQDHQGSLSYADTARAVKTISGNLPKFKPEVGGAFQPIPIEVSPQTKRALIKATINGVEGRFLLDTGTSDTILDAEFARKAGVDFVESCTTIIGGNYGKKGDIISFVRVPDMEMAGTHYRNFNAVLRDERGLRRDFSGRLDGVMGANVLFVKPLTLDYRRQLISFPTNTAGPYDFTFNLAPDHGKTAALDADIDGAKVVLMLDSGAAIKGTILVNERYQPAIRALAGDPKAMTYRAKEVRVAGQLILNNQLCLLRPFEETVIGATFFDRNVITVDLAAGKVLINRNAAEPQPTVAPLKSMTNQAEPK